LALFGLGRLYRNLTVVHFTADKSQNLLENTFNYPGRYSSVKSTTTMGEKMQKFSLWLAEYRLVFLAVYLFF
jgi:hypothetical protein